ncbi:CocE/NonD family hydrolase [Candidatus Microthrix sp.]|uniref:CocE/NonD family hydrolase n=3 Tax=Candidatus Neomicrothrix sp. TaxID=2719034 RepID=UPI0025C04D3C|nr:CocE/NonD family hydrolase [Candidatus Microthrix sp.]
MGWRRWGVAAASATMLLVSAAPASAQSTGVPPATGAVPPTGAASDPAPTPPGPADFGPRVDAATGLTLSPGVETLTVTGAAAGAAITLLDGDGAERLTLLADASGQAHFAYVPDTPMTLQSGTGEVPGGSGGVVEPGTYLIRVAGVTSNPVRVLATGEVADPSFYSGQQIGNGFGYVTTRDGTTLSVMVRLPGPIEDGPYPTVVEYSGYGASRPADPEPGSRIAGFLGFATVGVNMRGTGCSGGVFDVFNPAQMADGYDAIEAIASQDWVANNKVGMIGLSYAGISQLYVASTQPPSLEAISPMSVIDGPWREQWPGGVYNDGFTKQWLAERDRQSQAGGQSWDGQRIAQGDTVCANNQRIRTQNLDFEKFGRALENFPDALNARFLQRLVPKINVPVYLSGGYQDEQTGGRFGYLLDKFTAAPVTRFKLFNGHHPDGYSPMVATDWHDFLSFYVKREIPMISNLVRYFSPGVFEDEFGVRRGFGPNRFDSFQPGDFAGALAAYEAESPVQVLVESGATTSPQGATGERTRWNLPSFPPPQAAATTWYLAGNGALQPTAPTIDAADRYIPEPGAGSIVTTNANSTTFQKPVSALNAQWKQAPEGDLLAYATGALAADTVVAGPGYLDLWAKPGAPEAVVQVDLTEIRPDGQETYVQSGWHNLEHAGLDSGLTKGFQVEYTYTEADRVTLDPDGWVHRKVPIPAAAHVFRAGSKLRITVSSPGRSRPLWTFENPVRPPDAPVTLGRGGAHASSLVLPTMSSQTLRVATTGGSGPRSGKSSATSDIPTRPECGTLRGQPCRNYLGVVNVTDDPVEQPPTTASPTTASPTTAVPNDGFYNDCDSNDCFSNDGVPNDASSIGVPNNRGVDNSSGFDDRGSKDGVGRAVHLRFSDQGAGNSVIIHDATIQGRSGGNRCRGHRRGSAGRCQPVGPAQPHRLARWAARLGSSGHVACPWRVWRVWRVGALPAGAGSAAAPLPLSPRFTG